ncbi:MAG: hypothetical protein CMP48_19920 [Rickettsiales bacterium]|nr:hypothetical protein [Rickettsiales bacterium]
MKSNWVTLIVLSTIISVGCAQQKPENKESQAAELTAVSQELSEDAKLIETTCYACHNPNTASHDDILAPPLAGIKQRYLRSYPDKEEFVSKMGDFVFEPSEEKAMMFGPVRRFGVMPKTALTKEQVMRIVNYIYANELPEPGWFAEHEREMHGGN